MCLIQFPDRVSLLRRFIVSWCFYAVFDFELMDGRVSLRILPNRKMIIYQIIPRPLRVSLNLRLMSTLLLFGMLLLALASNALASQKRVALVIGNGAYIEGRLMNPVNDARLMTATLVSTGFEVTTLENATRRQMKEAISQFTRGLDEQSVGLFYFAGHGIEFGGENYLIPVDAEITQEADVEYESINAGRLLSGLRQSNGGLNLVILDACRNNPYARSFRSSSRGLSRMQPASGSLIFYATEPGSVASDGQGDNGIFTQHLVDAIRVTGKNIENVFKTTAINVSRATNKKQIPYIEGVLLGEFYFNGKQKAPSITVATLTSGTSNAETVFWQSVLAQPSRDMLDAYLRAYPDGHYAEIASIQLAMLSSPETKTKSKSITLPSTTGPKGVSGTYRSTIVHHSRQFRRFGKDPVEVTIEREGDKVSGTFSGGATGEIDGVVTGDEIEFEWYITAGGNATDGKGVWKISDDGRSLVGSWYSTQYEESGKWDLSRIEPVAATTASARAE